MGYPTHSLTRKAHFVFGTSMVDARLVNGEVYVPLREACTRLGWNVVATRDGRAIVSRGQSLIMPMQVDNGVGWVKAQDLAELGGWEVVWDPVMHSARAQLRDNAA